MPEQLRLFPVEETTARYGLVEALAEWADYAETSRHDLEASLLRQTVNVIKMLEQEIVRLRGC